MTKFLVSFDDVAQTLPPTVKTKLDATYAVHGEGGVIESPPGSGLFVSTLPSTQSAADAAISTILNTPTSETVTKLSATYAASERTQLDVPSLSKVPVVLGSILTVGATGAFDAGYVESPCVFLDPETGRLAMLYTAYTGPGMGGTASHGLAYSDDGYEWTKSRQFFTKSGVVGSPDEAGVTGPVMVIENGVFHLFYIGLTVAGYEGGIKTVCHATAPAMGGPWTRQGAVISPSAAGTGWRTQAVWRSNLVKRAGLWYLFFNATNAAGNERCGYATSKSLNGPWTVDDVNCPILPEAGFTTSNLFGGDPFVAREGDHWRMDFSVTGETWNAWGDFFATTTDAAFPLGWVVHGQVTHAGANEWGAFKPWIMQHRGTTFHYGSFGANVVLNIEIDPLLLRKQLVTKPWRFNPPTTNQAASLQAGEDVQVAAGDKPKIVLGASAAGGIIAVAQDSTHALLLDWNYDATPANAYVNVCTYGGNNPLWMQRWGGAIGFGSAAGSLGFFGKAPVARPAAVPVTVAGVHAALVALGLITA